MRSRSLSIDQDRDRDRGRGGVARTFDLRPTCAGALSPFWGHRDSIPLTWPPGRWGPALSSRLARSLGRSPHGGRPWPHCMTCLSCQYVQLPLGVSRRPQASMARRFRLHDGGTRRRLGNPCKQMQTQMHAGRGIGTLRETHFDVRALMVGLGVSTYRGGRPLQRRSDGDAATNRQTRRAFFGLPGIPCRLLHQC